LFKPHSVTNSYYRLKLKNKEVADKISISAAKAKELLEQQPVDVIYVDEYDSKADSKLNADQAVSKVAEAISNVGKKCKCEADTNKGIKQYDLTQIVLRLDKMCNILERIVYNLEKQDYENLNIKGEIDRDYSF